MDTIYQTSDGKEFDSRTQAGWHQEDLDKSSSSRGGPSKPSQSAISRERATDNLNQAVRCANNGEYEKAIELCNNNMSYLYLGSVINMPENVLANAYNTRGFAYEKLENRDQAIADYKKAVDVDNHESAKNNLARLGIQYTHNFLGKVLTPQPGDDLVDQALTISWDDKKKAFKLYEKAANMGNANAQFYLAICFRDGEGVRADRKKAKEWYKKAAAQGHAKAKEQLEEL
jgi:TPR repeat protein